MHRKTRRARPGHPTPLVSVIPALAAVAAAALLAACGGGSGPGSEPAAKVNKQEVTVGQVDFALQQQRGLKPEQMDAAGRQVLERLIDQSLAMQKADELKLDREPKVQQLLEAARREVLTKAYFDKVGDAAPKPTVDEMRRFYESRPALFRDRRIYNLQEILVEARPEQAQALREKLAAARNVGEFVEGLKADGLRFAVNQAVRNAEQLPPNSLEAFANMKDGQAMVQPVPGGVAVVVLAGSRPQPLTEEQARPFIEQMITGERRRKLVEDDLKAMRAAAKITYVGKYAQAASAPAAASSPR